MTCLRDEGPLKIERTDRRFARGQSRALARVGVAFAIIVTAGLSSVFAQTTRASTSGSSAPGDHWELRGAVFSEAATPVVGAHVTLRTYRLSKTVETAVDGSFSLELPNAPASGFLLAADSDGRRQAIYRPQEGDWQRSADSRPLRLVLKKADETPVTVVDGMGQPVAGAVVAACIGFFDISKETSDAAGRAVLRFPADADLQSVFAVKPGVGLDYFAFAQSGDSTDSTPRNRYRLRRGDRRPIELVLNGAKTAKLRFTDANYQPLAGVRVAPWFFQKPKKGTDLHTGGMEIFAQTTDAKGMATFDFIPPDNRGLVRFVVSSEEYAVPDRPVFNPHEGSKAISVVLLRREPLRGRVALADGKPGAGADVFVAGEGYGEPDFGRQTICDARGQFELRVDPNMFYVLVATLGHDISPRLTQVVRAGEAIPPVNLVVQPGTRVHGRWTRDADRRPVARQSLPLNEWVINDDYRAVPEERRIANPNNVRKMLLPKVLRWAKTDDQGRYEIYVAPGTYYLAANVFDSAVPYATVPIGRKNSVIEITDQRDFEIDFHSNRRDMREISGRVVLKADPTHGVPDASIQGFTADEKYATDQLSFVSDAKGDFAGRRSPCEFLLHAVNEDRSLSGFVRVTADVSKVAIPVSPTASAHGRLVDRSTGKPLANRVIHFGVPWKWQKYSSWPFGGETRTDARGEFIVKGLTPDRKWELFVDEEFTEVIGLVAPQSPARVELGDLKMSESEHPAPNSKPGR